MVHVSLHLVDLSAQLLLLIVQCMHVTSQLAHTGGELFHLLFQG